MFLSLLLIFLHFSKEFGNQLRAADQRINDALQEKAMLVAEYEGCWMDEPSSHSSQPVDDVQSVLRRCMQQADSVVSLANTLLQPAAQSENIDTQQAIRPSNYQLVDTSSKLRDHLSTLVGLIEQRDKMIASMRSEIDILNDRAQQLGVAPATEVSTANSLAPGSSPSPLDDLQSHSQAGLQPPSGHERHTSSSCETDSWPDSTEPLSPQRMGDVGDLRDTTETQAEAGEDD